MPYETQEVKTAPVGGILAAAGDNKEPDANTIAQVAFTTVMNLGLAGVRDGVVHIRKAGIMAIEHAMEHKQPTLLNKWLEGIAESKALKVSGPQAWIEKYCPYDVSGTSCTYNAVKAKGLLDHDISVDYEAATMENPFDMGKTEKGVEDFTASELLEALGRVITRHESSKKNPANAKAKEALVAAKNVVQSLH